MFEPLSKRSLDRVKQDELLSLVLEIQLSRTVQAKSGRRGELLLEAARGVQAVLSDALPGHGIDRLWLITGNNGKEDYLDLLDRNSGAFLPITPAVNLSNRQTIETPKTIIRRSDSEVTVSLSSSGDFHSQYAIETFRRFLEITLNIILAREVSFSEFDHMAANRRLNYLSSRFNGGSLSFLTYGLKLCDTLARLTSAKYCISFVVDGKTISPVHAYNNFGPSRYRTRLIMDSNQKHVIGHITSLREGSSELTGTSRSSLLAFVSGLKDRAGSPLFSPSAGRLFILPAEVSGTIPLIFLLAFSEGSSGLSASGLTVANRAAREYAAAAKFVFQWRTKKLIVDPVFKSRETRIIKDQAFLMMPFSEKWSSAVHMALVELMHEQGVKTVRADDLFGENIVEDIWTGIIRSAYVIADVTGRNPNVFYELGIAHAVGKRTLLLTQNVEDIPFDTRHLRHVVYSNDLSGLQKLRRGVSGFLNRN